MWQWLNARLGAWWEVLGLFGEFEGHFVDEVVEIEGTIFVVEDGYYVHGFDAILFREEGLDEGEAFLVIEVVGGCHDESGALVQD